MGFTIKWQRLKIGSKYYNPGEKIYVRCMEHVDLIVTLVTDEPIRVCVYDATRRKIIECENFTKEEIIKYGRDYSIGFGFKAIPYQMIQLVVYVSDEYRYIIGHWYLFPIDGECNNIKNNTNKNDTSKSSSSVRNVTNKVSTYNYGVVGVVLALMVICLISISTRR